MPSTCSRPVILNVCRRRAVVPAGSEWRRGGETHNPLRLALFDGIVQAAAVPTAPALFVSAACLTIEGSVLTIVAEYLWTISPLRPIGGWREVKRSAVTSDFGWRSFVAGPVVGSALGASVFL